MGCFSKAPWVPLLLFLLTFLMETIPSVLLPGLNLRFGPGPPTPGLFPPELLLFLPQDFNKGLQERPSPGERGPLPILLAHSRVTSAGLVLCHVPGATPASRALAHRVGNRTGAAGFTDIPAGMVLCLDTIILPDFCPPPEPHRTCILAETHPGHL